MEMEASSIVEEYKKIRPSYEEGTNKFDELFRSLIKESGIQVHSVSSRTKAIDSLMEKMMRKEDDYGKLADITDLSGIRVICYFSDQVDKVAEIVENNFIVLEDLSIDKRKMLDPDRFGYLSLHYIVKLSEERSKLLEYKRFKDLLCEIQIRSILQHAWAEIEHDLGYKSPIEIPRDIRRRFYRLAGLLELADDQFNLIKYEIEQYTEKVNTKLSDSPEEILIDKVSLEHFIVNSPIVTELDEVIVSNAKSISGEMIDIRSQLSRIAYFNIKTIDELEKTIKENKEKIISFAKDWLTGKYPQLPKGISLLYLGYLLIGSTQDKDKIGSYVTIIGKVSQDRRDTVVARIIKEYNKISKLK